MQRARFVILALAALVGSDARGESADCLIEPWRSIQLSAPLEGVVSEVLVDRGDRVKKGQVVARLEAALERANVATARSRARALGAVQSTEARESFARKTLERQQFLVSQNVASKQQHEEAQSAMRIAEADARAAREAREQAQLELRQAQRALERRTIRSPIDGVVTKQLVSAGEYVDPPEILELVQLDPLRVEVFAPLSLLGRIEQGEPAIVQPEAPIGGRFDATVTVIDPVVDPASGTFQVRLELPNPDHVLPAGLRCRVEFGSTSVAASEVDPPLPEGNPPTGRTSAAAPGSAIAPASPTPTRTQRANAPPDLAADRNRTKEGASAKGRSPSRTSSTTATAKAEREGKAEPKAKAGRKLKAEPKAKGRSPSLTPSATAAAKAGPGQAPTAPNPEASQTASTAPNPEASLTAATAAKRGASQTASPAETQAASARTPPSPPKPAPPPRVTYPVRFAAEKGTVIEVDGHRIGRVPMPPQRLAEGRRRIVARYDDGRVLQQTVTIRQADQLVTIFDGHLESTLESSPPSHVDAPSPQGASDS
ncbi:MAG: efflux RND transporter periplasmic adaptor subunit [bacterium]|nr:efflux RND transporter periplasmic adaptor subunit [bacterium]